MAELKKKPLFNPEGDIDVRLRRMIGGNTTNLNDFNNMKYPWVSQYADANMVKTDFFEARSTAYAKSTALEDDL